MDPLTLANFRVGELAAVISSPDVDPALRGQVVEITALESPCKRTGGLPLPAYRIELMGFEWCVLREYLRKLPPPDANNAGLTAKVSWKDMENLWQPKDLTVLS